MGFARHPETHRVEVAQVGVGISDPVDDRQVAIVPQPFELGEGRVERHVAIDRKRLVGGYRKRAVLVVVDAIVDRHDRVHAVVAAEHPDHHQDAVGGADRAERPRARVVPTQQFVEQRTGAARHHASADTHADQLQEPAPVEGVGIGLGRMQGCHRLRG